MHPNFKTVQELNIEYIPQRITQYESLRTGLRVAVIDREGPKVYGQLAFATEVLNNSGTPHTLEHLVFLGSRNFPYKGLLDRLANRAYAPTTNAWTSDDATNYTFETVGCQAFAQILPVYLDSVLLPLLTDAACYTEIQHIDGSGKDSGVVYSEMQSCAGDMDDIVSNAMKQVLYPETSGYRYNTGGALPMLRVLTADDIRAYHKEMYYPKNLRIVITGKIDHAQLLHDLEQYEQKNLYHFHNPPSPLRRPFVDNPGAAPLLASTQIKTIEFSDSDVSVGQVYLFWTGPKYTDRLTVAALTVMEYYLCGSQASVINHELVEVQQICSETYTDPSMFDRLDGVIAFYLTAVAVPKLSTAHDLFISKLVQTSNEPLDMSFMRDCITMQRRLFMEACETDPQQLAGLVQLDHTFGRRDGADLTYVQDRSDFDHLLQWTAQQWTDLLKTWFVDAPHLAYLATPSARLADDNEKAEVARVAEQCSRLGPDGLKELQGKLDKAKKDSALPVPPQLFDDFPIPDVSDVRLVSTTSATAGRARIEPVNQCQIQSLLDRDFADFKAGYLHFEHVPSNFVTIRIVMSAKEVPIMLKPLLAVYSELLFASPVSHHGRDMSFEELTVALERDTVEFKVSLAQGNPELMEVWISGEVEKYGALVDWLQTVMFHGAATADRLLSILAAERADLTESKRNANSMLAQIEKSLQLTQESTCRADVVPSQIKYLKRFNALVRKAPEEAIKKMSEVYQRLHRAENMRVLIIGDVTRLQPLARPWESFFAECRSDEPLGKLEKGHDMMNATGLAPGNVCHVVSVASTESSYMIAMATGLQSNRHPDCPALTVAVEYLCALTGPFNDAMRGSGLAYGVNFAQTPTFQQVALRVDSSPDASKVVVSARKILQGLADGSTLIQKAEFEGATSQVVVNLAMAGETMAEAASTSWYNQVLMDRGKDYPEWLISQTKNVTEQDVRKMIGTYLLPCLDPATSNVVVTCAPIMVKDLMEKLADAGYTPEQHDLDYYADDYGFEVEGGDEGESDEEDDEGDDDDDDDDDDNEEAEDVGDEDMTNASDADGLTVPPRL